MRFAFLGAGAVGGFYAALLSRSGCEVSVVARGAHLEAIRKDGLRVVSSAVGDFTARLGAEGDPARIGVVDTVVVAVKTYDNTTALPLLPPLVGPETTVLTLQNGVDSAEQVAAVVGEPRTIGGATYIATAIEAPGVIQADRHRIDGWCSARCSTRRPRFRSRVARSKRCMKAADIHAEAVADARTAIWEKFAYLAPFAAFTGAARLPIGPRLGRRPQPAGCFWRRSRKSRRSPARTGVVLPDDHRDHRSTYTENSAEHAVVAADRSLAGQTHRSGGAAGQPSSAAARRRRADADHGSALRGAQAARARSRGAAAGLEVSVISFCV